MKKRKMIFLFWVNFILPVNIALPNERGIDTQEYELKAAFIFHFTEYVEWENISEGETFNISVLGKSPITASLLEIAKDKKVKNKQVTVKGYDDAASVGPCQILFISRSFSLPVETIIEKFGDKHILIITEHDGDAAKGAHINFLISDNRIKFEINLKAATKAGIKIGSQLLQHAIIVDNQ